MSAAAASPPSAARLAYLRALLELGAEARPVPTGELARQLGVTPASVTTMTVTLAELGLCDRVSHRGTRLTGAGAEEARCSLRREQLLVELLVRDFAMPAAEALDEARRVGGAISARLEQLIALRLAAASG